MANEKKFEVVGGGVSIVSTGKKTVQVQEEFEKAVQAVDAGPGASLADMYDRLSKLLYVVDASVSMAEGMLSKETIKMYLWPEELLEQYRVWMSEQYETDKEAFEQAMEDLQEQDEDGEGDFELPEQPVDPATLSDDQLKEAIVMQGLEKKSGIALTRNYGYRSSGQRTKMMAVKDAAKEFVHKRFEKYPDARVMLFQFSDYPELLAGGANEQEVLDGISRLPDGGIGGTNIHVAVERAVNECKKRPSEVNSHHIVLVSDGCDYGAVHIKDLLPKMKELGMVFDFIFIIGASDSEQAPKDVVEVLKMVCESTGGEYVEVRTEQDFKQKFLAASSRPMLPPGR